MQAQQDSSKKRQLEDDIAEQALAQLNAEDAEIGPQLPPKRLKEVTGGSAAPADSDDPKDKRIASLEGRLQHLRSWMQALQQHQQQQLSQFPANRDNIVNARRLYIGGIPLAATEAELMSFLSDSLIACGGAVEASGRPVRSCRLQRDTGFAFVELRTAEEASNAMALDGLVFRETALRVRRPSKWDASVALMLGPIGPDPSMDLSVLRIVRPQLLPAQRPAPAAVCGAAGVGVNGAAPAAAAPGSGAMVQQQQPPMQQQQQQPMQQQQQQSMQQQQQQQGATFMGGRSQQTWNTLFIGGLPCEWSTDQCLELLRVYGDVKYFKLMTHKLSGASRGFGFCEYVTDESTVAALKALDGALLGERRLAANRVLEHKQREAAHAQQNMARFEQLQAAAYSEYEQQQMQHMQMPGYAAAGAGAVGAVGGVAAPQVMQASNYAASAHGVIQQPVAAAAAAGGAVARYMQQQPPAAAPGYDSYAAAYGGGQMGVGGAAAADGMVGGQPQQQQHLQQGVLGYGAVAGAGAGAVQHQPDAAAVQQQASMYGMVQQPQQPPKQQQQQPQPQQQPAAAAEYDQAAAAYGAAMAQQGLQHQGMGLGGVGAFGAAAAGAVFGAAAQPALPAGQPEAAAAQQQQALYGGGAAQPMGMQMGMAAAGGQQGYPLAGGMLQQQQLGVMPGVHTGPASTGAGWQQQQQQQLMQGWVPGVGQQAWG